MGFTQTSSPQIRETKGTWWANLLWTFHIRPLFVLRNCSSWRRLVSVYRIDLATIFSSVRVKVSPSILVWLQSPHPRCGDNRYVAEQEGALLDIRKEHQATQWEWGIRYGGGILPWDGGYTDTLEEAREASLKSLRQFIDMKKIRSI